MSEELFDAAVRLEEAGQLDRALPLWRQLAKSDPTRNVFLRLANITEDLGLTAEAESAFKRALEIDNRSTVALIGLGSLAIDRRDFETAAGYLEKACEIEEDPCGLSLLGVALQNTAKDIDAEQAYRRAIHIDPKYEEAYYNLGVLLRHSRPLEAQALFRTALELDPNYACAYRELGYSLCARGAEPETAGPEAAEPDAERYLRKAIELDAEDAWAHIYLGTLLWLRADVQGARAEFQTAADLQPDWAVPQWSLGNLYEHALQNSEVAEDYFKQALNVEPNSEVALKCLYRLRENRSHS